MKKIKIYKTIPSKRLGWEATDPARDLKQAKEFIKGGYGRDTDAIIVQTGNKGDIFPYTIYTRYRGK